MKFVLKHLKKYKLECFFAPFFKLLEACFDLFVPLVVKDIIDVGIKNGDKNYIYTRILILVALGIIGLVCALTAQYFAAKAAVGASTSMRSALFTHLTRLSYTETDTVGTSTMITRMTGDINQVQTGVNMTLRLFLRSPIIVFGAMIMAYLVRPQSVWIFAILIVVLSIIVFTVILAGIPLYRRVQTRLDRVTALTRENLSGVRVVRAFNMEEEQSADFTAANISHTRAQRFAGNIASLMNPLTYVCVNLGIIALVYLSASSINAGEMLQGDLVAVYNYMTQILVELVKLATTIFTVIKAVASAKRVSAVFDIPTTDSKIGDDKIGESAVAVEFKNVSLTYRGGAAPTLSNIDFSVMRGETVGIIGGTGSGKTSLVNLIPAFYPATEGEVNIFGKSVDAYSPDTLRSAIAVVEQRSVLFRGTIRSNLLWGNAEATDEDMWRALELACAADFVREKDGGLDAHVSQKGKNFSGGQRQRLSIARAIIKRSPILILDDSASALDFATEARLRQNIASLDYKPTVFIISQRSSSISHADKIVVLDDGKLVGIGTHDALVNSCEAYREIYESQFYAAGDLS